VGIWTSNFKSKGDAVKWVRPSTAEGFKNFENDTVEKFAEQVLAEVSGAQ
jgi:hypothetical protein